VSVGEFAHAGVGELAGYVEGSSDGGVLDRASRPCRRGRPPLTGSRWRQGPPPSGWLFTDGVIDAELDELLTE
jgi:hypothetical protein